MRTGILNVARKVLAVMMITALLITDIPWEVLATHSENGYQSKLDGWTVHAVWNTSSTDYEWDALENTSRQPKITVTYRIRNAEKDYPKGAVTLHRFRQKLESRSCLELLQCIAGILFAVGIAESTV